MWVLSQNKTKMVEIKGEVEVQGCTIQAQTSSHWTKMGEYKTSKEAEEVLGRIFSGMQNGGTTFVMPGCAL